MTFVCCSRRIRIVVLMVGLLSALAACRDPGGSPGQGPAPARRGLDADGRMQISRQDRCPVCAMPVAEHERFSAAVVVADGSTFYFCTPGCMLRAWLKPERYLNRSRAQLVKPVARDYFTGDCIDGRNALWVSGSDVIGPMGPALVALKSDDELTAFRKRHGAGRVFRLSALRVENWAEMIGKRPGD
ncbi:MAG: nitrous oxide reductase accessory protein NosL [Desulfobacterales bacterium]|jgi:nitrous oxide reductase accessory protein NosL